MEKEYHADLVIIGGGLGGCAAAWAAAGQGKTVIMTEETEWIGGQLTSQAVPPDEHPWIEQYGATAGYRLFRTKVRDFYRTRYPLTGEARQAIAFNPGNGSVSKLCHEPRVALAVLKDMLAPYMSGGSVTVLTCCTPVGAEADGDRIRSVTVKLYRRGDCAVLTAPMFVDATECGDLLPLAGVEYVTGAESRQDTGEPHALSGAADPADMQAMTCCFAMDYRESEDHTIDRPEDYGFWSQYAPGFWTGRWLSWTRPHHITLEPVAIPLFPSMWEYRRIIDRSNFVPGTYESDMTIVNWTQNDYILGSIIDVSPEEKARHLRGAKQLSLSLLYWMQTEAPRPDGGAGYPGLRLRPDVTGTADGLAMHPYIRESRRIKAEFTVTELHVGAEARGGTGQAEIFTDSVGIGSYRIDLHPSTGMRNYIDIEAYPFQIPLGALLPVRMRNLLPACKNIGTTHITNGCYRLHPVEWNIGEAAGTLAAFCLDRSCEPKQVRQDERLLSELQSRLMSNGVELSWPRP